jgi:hypothetical protein
MEFVMSGKFVVGLIVGALLYHLWMMKMAKKAG